MNVSGALAAFCLKSQRVVLFQLGSVEWLTELSSMMKDTLAYKNYMATTKKVF